MQSIAYIQILACIISFYLFQSSFMLNLLKVLTLPSSGYKEIFPFLLTTHWSINHQTPSSVAYVTYSTIQNYLTFWQ